MRVNTLTTDLFLHFSLFMLYQASPNITIKTCAGVSFQPYEAVSGSLILYKRTPQSWHTEALQVYTRI
jgi:hypothetical protein